MATGADATLATARVGLLDGTVAAEVATALVSDRTFAVGATLVGVFAATDVTDVLVCVQGALGMWTVTLLLKPAIVSAHA